MIYGTKDGANRGSRSQYRQGNVSKYNSNFGKRDLSVVNGRLPGKLAESHLNNSYMNTSVDTTNSRSLGVKANTSSNNKLQKIKKMNNNISVTSDKDKSRLESGRKKQDTSVNNIKFKNSSIRNEGDNIKAQIETKGQKDSGDKNKKELSSLKGLKTVKKQKIETSVKL